MTQSMKSSKLLQMTIPLEDILGLGLECTYYYEPPVPEDDINPPEQAVVELVEVHIGDSHSLYPLRLSREKMLKLEQEIYDRIEQGY